jgi:hypothetical protein
MTDEEIRARYADFSAGELLEIHDAGGLSWLEDSVVCELYEEKCREDA